MKKRLDDLGISQPTQMAKEAELKKIHYQKRMLSRKSQGFAQLFANNSEKSKGQSIQSHKWLFEEINGVTHRSFQASQKKPKIENYLVKICR